MFELKGNEKMDTKIISVSLLVLSLCSTLLFADLISKPAFAVEGVHSVTGMTSTELFYNGGANSYIAHTASTTTIEKISTSSFTRTTATLPAGTYNGRGDCSLTSDVCVFTTTANAIRAVNSAGTQLWSVTADSSALTGAGFTDIVESLGVVLVSVTCSANSNRILQEYDLGTGVFIKNVGNCAGTALGNGINTANGYFDSATSYIITMQGAGQVGNFQIWNISPTTPTRTCTWATVTTITGTEGDIIKIGSTYYISDGTTMQALTSACADTTDIGSGSHGMSTIINLYKSTVRNEYYVEDITGFAVMNVTTPTQKISEMICTATSATDPSIFADEFIQVACLDDTGNIVTVIEIATVGEVNPNDEFCAQPENANILTCRLANQNGQLASFADLVGGTFGNSTNNLFVQLGLVPSGSDIKTNGVGYAFVVVGLGLMTAILYLASGGDLHRIPTFVWFLGSLSIVGGLAGFDFIDPVFFIIAILVVIALASGKILSTLEIGGFR